MNTRTLTALALMVPGAIFAESPAPNGTATDKAAQEAATPRPTPSSPEKSRRDVLEQAWKDAMKEEARVMARRNMGQASLKELDQAAAKTAAAKKALADWKSANP